MGAFHARGKGGRGAVPFGVEPPTLDDLWAYGRYDLRLSEHEFWGMTPAQLDLLSRRHVAEVERGMEQAVAAYEQSERRAAFIVAAIYEIFRDPKKRAMPFTVDDFLTKKAQTWEEQLEMGQALVAMFGGEDLRGG